MVRDLSTYTEAIQNRVLDMLFYPLIRKLHSEKGRVSAPGFEWPPFSPEKTLLKPDCGAYSLLVGTHFTNLQA